MLFTLDGIEFVDSKYKVTMDDNSVRENIESLVDAVLIREQHSKKKMLPQDFDDPLLGATMDRYYKCIHCARTIKTQAAFPQFHVCSGEVVTITSEFTMKECTQHSATDPCWHFDGYGEGVRRRKMKPLGIPTKNNQIFENNGQFELWFDERFLGTYLTFDQAEKIFNIIKKKNQSSQKKINKNKRGSRHSSKSLKRGYFSLNPRHLRGIFRKENFWEARVRTNGKFHDLGKFENPIQAALQWDKSVRNLIGLDAATNYPPETSLEDAMEGKVKPNSLRTIINNSENLVENAVIQDYFDRGYLRGVQKNNQTFVATVRLNGNLHQLGMSNNPVSAALKYDAACRQLFGKNAWTNFPENTLLQNVISKRVKPKLLVDQEKAVKGEKRETCDDPPNLHAHHPWANLRFRGVHRTGNGRFRTRIYHNKQKISCGTYGSVFKAALAWDRKKSELKGDVWTNFPDGTTEDDILDFRVKPNPHLLRRAEEDGQVLPVIPKHGGAKRKKKKDEPQYDEIEDEVFQFLEEQKKRGIKMSADKIKKIFRIGWTRAKSVVTRFYESNETPKKTSKPSENNKKKIDVDEAGEEETDEDEEMNEDDMCEEDEEENGEEEEEDQEDEGYLHRKSDWNRVVGVGTYYQAKVEEWTGKSYNSLKRRPIIGAKLFLNDFEYQLKTGRDGRHFSLSRWFICLHCPQHLVEGDLLVGQPTVVHRCGTEKAHRSLKTQFRHCHVTHDGPCIYAIPNEIETPLGSAIVKAVRLGKMFEVDLPYGKAFVSSEWMMPHLLKTIQENSGTPYIPDQNAKETLDKYSQSSDEGEVGNYIYCVDCGAIVEAAFGRVNNCYHFCKAFGKRVQRTFNKHYSRCEHEGPCIHEMPLKLITPFGVGKVAAICETGQKLKLHLPWAKMYSYTKEFVPWIIESIRSPHLLESAGEEENLDSEEDEEIYHRYGLRKRRALRPDRKYNLHFGGESDDQNEPEEERYEIQPSRKKRKRSGSEDDVIQPKKKRKKFYKFCPHPHCRWKTQVSSKPLVLQHYKKHNDTNAKFSCRTCNLGFVYEASRDKHETEYHGKKEYHLKCPVCDREFSDFKIFKQHNESRACRGKYSRKTENGSISPEKIENEPPPKKRKYTKSSDKENKSRKKYWFCRNCGSEISNYSVKKIKDHKSTCKKVKLDMSKKTFKGVKPAFGDFWLAIDEKGSTVGLFSTPVLAAKAVDIANEENHNFPNSFVADFSRVDLPSLKCPEGCSNHFENNIELLSHLYFTHILSNVDKGVLKIDNTWAFWSLKKTSVKISYFGGKLKLNLDNEDTQEIWKTSIQNYITTARKQKLIDLVDELRKMSASLRQYPSQKHMRDLKLWKMIQNHASVGRTFGGRESLRKFVLYGLEVEPISPKPVPKAVKKKKKTQASPKPSTTTAANTTKTTPLEVSANVKSSSSSILEELPPLELGKNADAVVVDETSQSPPNINCTNVNENQGTKNNKKRKLEDPSPDPTPPLKKLKAS